jgi:hypothetical protein
MRNIGFSTGALAKGDFRKGIKLQENESDSLELSALREAELEPLLAALPYLQMDRFKYVSLHAPSHLTHLSESELVAHLMRAKDKVQSIIVHPDIIKDPHIWLPLEDKLVLENMDQRKPSGRNAKEMQWLFERLPKARFCFDIGHARQVDPTLGVAIELLTSFATRLAEIHISEVDADGNHVSISNAAMNSFKRVSPLIPKTVPAIIESIIGPESIADEMSMARASLGDAPANRASR